MVVGNSHEESLAAALLGKEKLARRMGLLHDIGKAIDHEVEGPHAVIGSKLAKKFGEQEEIAYAIGAHHEDLPPQSVLDVLVQSADALSGARSTQAFISLMSTSAMTSRLLFSR